MLQGQILFYPIKAMIALLQDSFPLSFAFAVEFSFRQLRQLPFIFSFKGILVRFYRPK